MYIKRLEGVTPEFIAKLKADIVALLNSDYELTKEVADDKPYRRYKTVGTGVFVKGNSVSYIKDSLLGIGYKNFGSLSDFEDTIRELGFSLKPSKNTRGNKGLVVFVK